MSETKHTPGKVEWQEATGPRGRKLRRLVAVDGRVQRKVIVVDHGSLGPSAADEGRIAACWNACDGIDEPAALRDQRDKLLAMLEEVLSSDPDMIGHKRTMAEAEELIADCKAV